MLFDSNLFYLLNFELSFHPLRLSFLLIYAQG